MRVASWVLIVCALIAAIALFLPCLEVRVHGALLSKRTSVSLYGAKNHEDLVRRLLAAYRASGKRKLGAEVIEAVAPKVHGKGRAMLDDARDAMSTLDDVTDDDVKTAATALTVTVWTFLGLAIVLMLLVGAETMRGAYRKHRMIAALAITVFVAAAGIGLHLVLREVAWEANDEFGGNAVSLAAAAYLLPIAAGGTFVSAIVLLVRRGREKLSLTPL